MLSLFSTFIFAVTSKASVCVEVNKDLDDLSIKERRAAKDFIESALVMKGFLIDNKNCESRFVVYHLKLRRSIAVVVSDGKKSKKIFTKNMKGLPGAYLGLIDNFFKITKIDENKGELKKTNVKIKDNKSIKQELAKEILDDHILYASLGYGSIVGKGGASIGVGYRYVSGNFAFDLSFFNYIFASDKKNESYTQYNGEDEIENNLGGDVFRVGVFYYCNPESDISFYFGGGIGWGGFLLGDDGNTGVNLSPIIGFELFRSSSFRMFLQANYLFSTYKIGGSYQSVLNFSFSIAYGANPKKLKKSLKKNNEPIEIKEFQELEI